MKRKLENLELDINSENAQSSKKMKRSQKINLWKNESIHNSNWKIPIKFSLKSIDSTISEQNIIPTKLEERVFSFLLNVLKHFSLKNTILRVAGGWVRNKLLGIPSDDIDITLNDMTGENFCKLISEYSRSLSKDSSSVVGKFAVIKINPEQSKHLETATMNLFDLSIDFANLRSEEYGSVSRIPIIKIGTPLEDAMRRDFTINSLFYNINERKVEDCTKMGLIDLKMGIIRTPLKPLQTFLDDPLRILRCIRFASRYNFSIDEKIFKVFTDEETNEKVLFALQKKVTRERVGVEVVKILKSKDPIGGFAAIKEMGIEGVVFALSSVKKVKKNKVREFKNPISIKWKDEKQWKNSLSRMRYAYRIINDERYVSVMKTNDRKCLLLGSFLSPLLSVKEFSVYEKMEDFCSNLFISSLKLSKLLAREVCDVIYYANKIWEFVHVKEIGFGTSTDGVKDIYMEVIRKNRLTIGKWIRKVKKLCFHSLIVSNVLNTSENELTETIYKKDGKTKGELFYEVLKESRLLQVMNMKPALNGKEVASILGIKPGKLIGVLLKELIEYQINNPSFTKENVIEFIKKKKK